MGKTKIEWVKNPDGTQGYSWNPITGCLNGCDYCYARKLANTRLKERYLANRNIAPNLDTLSPELPGWNDPFFPRFWEDRLAELVQIKRGGKIKPRGIFVCDMSDLFGIGIPENWTERVLEIVRGNWQDRFYLLTKQPQNLSKFEFPYNCWVGVTATDTEMYNQARIALWETKASIKYLSFEPLLSRINMSEVGLLNAGISWVIIGAQTKPTVMPKIEWVKEIIFACDRAGVKVFLKDSLYDFFIGQPHSDLYWQDMSTLRQEMPR